MSIPVDKCYVSPFNVRVDEEFGDEEDLEFAENVDKFGVQDPVIARPVGEMYEVNRGRRRLLSAKMKGKKEIIALVGDFTDEEFIDNSLMETIFSRETNPIAIGKTIAKRLEMGGISLSDYAKMIGKPVSTLSEWLRMNDLTPAMQKEVQDGNVAFRDALKVARMELSPEIEDNLAEESKAGGKESFKKALDRLQKGQEKRGAPPGLQILRINFGQESTEYDALKQLADAEGMDMGDYCMKILTDHIRLSNN